MRRLVYVAAISLAMFGLGSAPAWADNGPHVPTKGQTAVDRCAGCHRAHTAQATYLLRDAQPALCYTCHGSGAGGASTDVRDGVGYTGFERGTPAGALRGGGFEFALINSGAATKEINPANGRSMNQHIPVLASGQAATSSHNVDGSMQTAWGNGAIGSGAGTQISLRCGSCHDPHGNGNYRILRAVPEESGVATASGITIADTSNKIYTTSDYWNTDDTTLPANVTVGTATVTPFIANISAWCTTCHTRYLAPSGSYKTDSGDPVYMYRHRTDVNTKQGGANCITCHVAHGSNAVMDGTNSKQVAFPDATSKLGDSKLLRVDNRGTCNMCHNV